MNTSEAHTVAVAALLGVLAAALLTLALIATEPVDAATGLSTHIPHPSDAVALEVARATN